MKTILLSFVLIINQPNSMTVPEAKKVQEIAIEKLNTLSPSVKFRALPLRRMRDPFPEVSDGEQRVRLFNNKFRRDPTAANYVHILDKKADETLAGIAFICQPMNRRGQVSISLPVLEKIKGVANYTIWGVIAAHEIAHQLGFWHVNVFDKPWSIMDEFVYALRHIRHKRWFEFIDKMDVLDQMGCEQNRVS